LPVVARTYFRIPGDRTTMGTTIHGGAMPSFSLLLAVAGATAPAAIAHADGWRSLGPHGGNITTLLADPAQPGRAYATGGGGLFRTTDGGSHWTRAETGIAGSVTGDRPFALDHEAPTTLYVVDRSGRLHVSANAAVSWNATGYTVPDGDSIAAIADMRGNTGVVLIALSSGKILRSNDHGSSFMLLGDAGVRPSSIDVHGDVPMRILVGTVYPHSVQLSVDGGGTFAAVDGTLYGTAKFDTDAAVFIRRNNDVYACPGSPSPCELRASGATSMLPDRHAPGILYVGREDGNVSLYSNGGANHVVLYTGASATDAVTTLALQPTLLGEAGLWVGFNAGGVRVSGPSITVFTERNDGIESSSLRSVALDPRNASRLFTALDERASGSGVPPLFWSFTAGQSWLRDLGGRADFVRSIAIDPTTAGDPFATRLFAVGRSTGFTGTASGIFSSVDGGLNWTTTYTGLVGPTGSARIGTVRNVVLDPRSCASPPAIGRCQSGPLQTVYALATGRNFGEFRIVRSIDGGLTWADRTANLPIDADVDDDVYESLTPIALVFDPRDDDVLHVATFASIYDADDNLAPGTIPNGVFRSTNRGASWHAMTTGLPLRAGSTTTTQDVLALAGHPRRSGWLWAAVTPESGVEPSRIYRTTDGGTTWSDSSTGLANCFVRAVEVDAAAPNVIYASGFTTDASEGCVFRSEDSGATWYPLHDGLPADSVGGLQRDPLDQGRLVVATNSGLWELRNPPDSIFEDGNDE
jgi:photosystem II stability/assembly factor-like uncharacterized protein